MDTSELQLILIAATQEFWKLNARPLLLSNLPAVLAKTQVTDYRAVLKGESLKSFVKRTADSSSYRVIVHPEHRAKIGLIPAGENFEYPVEAMPSSDHEAEDVATSNDAITLLGILSRLSESDLEKIVIPASVFANLYKKS